jgi:Lon protease-like protein
VGYIVEQNHLPDGRYNVLLQGLCRAKLIREWPPESDKLYRQGLLEPTDVSGAMEIDLSQERQAIDTLLADPLLNELAAVHAMHKWLADDIPTSTLVDLGTMTLCEESQARYDMLQETAAAARAQRFLQMLEHTRSLLKTARRLAPRELTDHMYLN